MAFPAGKWRFNRGVADQAIGHLRHSCWRDLARLPEAPVAGLARIVGAEKGSDGGCPVARALQIYFVIDGGDQEARDITHLQMQGMAEMRQVIGRGRRNFGLLMTSEADILLRQQIVLRLSACGRRDVTGNAVESHPQVQAMRKRSSAPRGARREANQ